VFKFATGEPVQQAVLDASEIDTANGEIMTRYHIPADHVLNAALVQDTSGASAASAPVVDK